MCLPRGVILPAKVHRPYTLGITFLGPLAFTQHTGLYLWVVVEAGGCWGRGKVLALA